MSVIEILQKLVSFPVLGGENNEAIADWVERYLIKHGVEFFNLSHDEGKRCIYCRIGPAVDGGVILSGHMDVVPVAGQAWTSDPFVLTDRGDGRLYGRGSCDMKGFLACCLARLPEMLKADLKRPIYFAFSYDEEIGCMMGTPIAEAIREHFEETPQYAIIGEPSMLQPILGQKGIVIYETTVNGSAGHSSRIRTEVSAIHEASRLIIWLENKMNELYENGHVDERFTPPHTSIHCGIFKHSGIAPNVISDSAIFSWDVRVIPMDRASSVLAEFEEHCRAVEQDCQKRFTDFKITTKEVHPDVPALDTPENLSIVELIKSISPRQDLGTVAYAAEAGQFSLAGFETVICGPGDIAQAHRANEFIDKVQLDMGVEMMGKLIEKLSHD